MKRRPLAPEVVFPTASQSNSPIEMPSPRHGVEMDGFPHYEAIAACRESGQIDDEAWEVYMADHDFAAWYLVGQLDI
jgi:hypothetical protein